MVEHADVVVIGMGPGGEDVASRAMTAPFQVAMVMQWEPGGEMKFIPEAGATPGRAQPQRSCVRPG